MIVQAIRSLIFYVLFVGQTAIVAIIIGTVALFAPNRTGFTWPIARYWCWSNVWLIRLVGGIRTEVTGMENIPPGGCIIASKHQSDWDVFAIFPYTEKPAYIVKKELMDLPFFGRAARSLDCIEVDRKKGAEAIPQMMARVRAALERGCRIVIFPEGTRKAPLAPPDYRAGIMRMYTALNVPVVPVALDSGLYWGRNSLVLWPGTARAKFLPPILPGLSAAEFQRRLAEAIETETNAMILEAVEKGLSRPITPEFRAKVTALEAARGTAGETRTPDIDG